VLGTHLDRYTIETDGVVVAPVGDWEGWQIISWRATITFCTGHRLDVSETYGKTLDSKVIRSLSYHFMGEQGRCIFRFDTHGRQWPLETPCHLHIGESEEALEQDDPRLSRIDMGSVDFLSAFRYAFGRALENKAFPWD